MSNELQQKHDMYRAAFEQWYVENCFDLEANPIGSRDFTLQWKAWDAAAKALAPEVIEIKQQLAASAAQYQEACDDAHRFAAENERLRRDVERLRGSLHYVGMTLEQMGLDTSDIEEALKQSPSSAPAESVKTRLYFHMPADRSEPILMAFSKEHLDSDTHYIDIAEDGSIVGGKIT